MWKYCSCFHYYRIIAVMKTMIQRVLLYFVDFLLHLLFLIRINYRPCANRSAISHFFIQQIQCWACGCKGPHEHGQKKGRKARTITISSLKMRWCDFFSFNRAKIITAQTIWFSVYNRRVHISMAGSIEGMSAQVFSATSCSLKQELYKRGNGNMKGFQAYNEHWRYPCKDLVK